MATEKTNINLLWQDDVALEGIMEEVGIEYSTEVISFSDINLPLSQHNGARLSKPLIDEAIEDYGSSMMNGDRFPMIAGHSTPKGIVILSGVQRSAAVDRLITEGRLLATLEIEMYVISTKDPVLIEILAKLANKQHGFRASKEERLLHAVHMVENNGLSCTKAAQLNNVGDHAVMVKVRCNTTRNWLAEKKIVIGPDVPMGTLDAMSRLDDDLKVKFGKIVRDHNPKAHDVKAAIEATKTATTTSARNRAVNNFARDSRTSTRTFPGCTGGRSRFDTKTKQKKFHKLMSSLASFLETGNSGGPFKTPEELQVFTASDLEDVFVKWERIKQSMQMTFERIT